MKYNKYNSTDRPLFNSATLIHFDQKLHKHRGHLGNFLHRNKMIIEIRIISTLDLYIENEM